MSKILETAEQYEELCEMLFGDSDYTHEEAMERLELAVDCLRYVEDNSLWKEFNGWNIQNKKENGYE